jgi:hypothetical protein
VTVVSDIGICDVCQLAVTRTPCEEEIAANPPFSRLAWEREIVAKHDDLTVLVASWQRRRDGGDDAMKREMSTFLVAPQVEPALERYGLHESTHDLLHRSEVAATLVGA